MRQPQPKFLPRFYTNGFNYEKEFEHLKVKTNPSEKNNENHLPLYKTRTLLSIGL